jgi:hypothetical protein
MLFWNTKEKEEYGITLNKYGDCGGWLSAKLPTDTQRKRDRNNN